jgi:hypothetical protein
MPMRQDHGNSATCSLKKRAALRPPVPLFQRLRRRQLIEVSFGLVRRAVPPPRWPDVLQPEEEQGVRKLPEAALAAPRLAEGRDGRKPPEAAPAAGLLVSQRMPAVG